VISIIQNFICTKDARLEIINNNISSLGDVFGEFEFFVNYGTNINLDKIHSLYKHHIPKLNFFNNLEKDWAKVTLALANEINTPYTIFLCEDMVVNASKDKIHKCINEYVDNDYDYLLFTKLHKYLQQEYINGYTPYNSNISPGYKKLKNGYFYLGQHAPHKRLSTDAIYKTDWYKERLQEFIEKRHLCNHDIPIKVLSKPNYYEGYYDFNNGMARFKDLKCYIPDEVIMLEYDTIKENR
tara:strand:+ start:40 stop:759 length:720 start_codon:yes stop_codon:yes gene_type:complete